MPVFYVAAEVADAGVENVTQRVFPEEEVAEDAHASGKLVFQPESAQVCDGVDGLLEFNHVVEEAVEGHSGEVADLLDHVFVLLHEADDGLSIILGDVLGLILEPFVFGLRCFLVGDLVLRDPGLLGDPPVIFIEIVVEDELGQDGLGHVGDHGEVLFLFLDQFVQHAAVLVVVISGENVIEFDFAHLLAGLVVVVVWQHAEVEDGRAIIGFNEH
jgi:hypothetical protein